MKRLLFLLFLATTLQFANAQSNDVRITLTNGKILTGTLMFYDFGKEAKLQIGNIETTVPAANILKIESINVPDTVDNVSGFTKTNIKISKKIGTPEKSVYVTDRADYPATYDLKVGPYTIKMHLVRGGSFAMGYDGRNSLAMDSEPVHIVNVTSFYMAEEPLTYEQYYYLKSIEKSSKNKPKYATINRDDVTEFQDIIQAKLSNKISLPSEAEWEYAAFSENHGDFFNLYFGKEFCRDYFEDYTDEDNLTEPVYKEVTARRVIRAYYFSRKHDRLDKLNRSNKKYYGYDAACRLVIKAKDI